MKIHPLTTVPNVVTLVRTIAATSLAGVAIHQATVWLLAVAYGVYWVGDVLDGWLARRLNQETRFGAVFDIISDRACTSILCLGLMVAFPELTQLVILFFLSFMVLDTMLSLSFLCWPVVSPNYFGAIDPLVYRLNWSPVAKGVNTAGVILLAVAGLAPAAFLLVVALVGVKAWSAARVISLRNATMRTAS